MDFTHWYIQESNQKTEFISGFTNKIYKESDFVFNEAVEKRIVSEPADHDPPTQIAVILIVAAWNSLGHSIICGAPWVSSF